MLGVFQQMNPAQWCGIYPTTLGLTNTFQRSVRTDQLASLDAKQTESVTDFLHFEKTQSLAYFMLLLSKTSLIATVTKMIHFVDFSKHVGAVFWKMITKKMTQRRSWEKFQCQVRHDWGGDDRLMVKPSSLLLIILCTLNSLAFFSDTETGWFPIWTLNNFTYFWAMISCEVMNQNYIC